MNNKEIGEIRRRFRLDRSNISHIYCCYVNSRREIVSQFVQSMVDIKETEKEMYFSLLKKCLAGTLNKNLLDIKFTTAQVVDSKEHSLLMNLKKSSLKDEEALKDFYNTIIDNIMIEGNYLILLATEKYDVPFKGRDGSIFNEESDSTFEYFITAICPVNESVATLEFVPLEKIFKNSGTSDKVQSPVLGMMFPCFDDRATNIYNALYFTKNSSNNHPELAKSLFNFELNLPADEEKEVFQNILCESLHGECNLETIQTVQNKIEEIILEHKESKNPEALTLEKGHVVSMLEDCGISDEKVDIFSQKYDEQLGEHAKISPKNIINERQFQVETPNVIIKVKPEFKNLIQTKIIDGRKYILIDAENSVEVNGINIEIEED